MIDHMTKNLAYEILKYNRKMVPYCMIQNHIVGLKNTLTGWLQWLRLCINTTLTVKVQ